MAKVIIDEGLLGGTDALAVLIVAMGENGKQQLVIPDRFLGESSGITVCGQQLVKDLTVGEYIKMFLKNNPEISVKHENGRTVVEKLLTVTNLCFLLSIFGR